MKRSEAQHLPGLDEVRNAVAELASDQPLRLVVLFGSMARGDAGARDVDLGLLGEARLDLDDDIVLRAVRDARRLFPRYVAAVEEFVQSEEAGG